MKVIMMVVNAKKLEQRVLTLESDNIMRVEKVIDAALEKTFDGQRATFDVPKEYTQLRDLTQKNILKKYRAAGWNVKYESSQRDGDYFEFVVKKKIVRNNIYSQYDR